jgi:hypothetical protein
MPAIIDSPNIRHNDTGPRWHAHFLCVYAVSVNSFATMLSPIALSFLVLRDEVCPVNTVAPT